MVIVPGVSGEAVINLVSSAHIRCSNVGLRCSTLNNLPSCGKGVNLCQVFHWNQEIKNFPLGYKPDTTSFLW